MKDNLSKLYPRLLPVERFELALAAISRGDQEEARRLGETCPRKNYEMLDAEFVDLWNGSRMAAVIFAYMFESCFWRVEAAHVMLALNLMTEQYGDKALVDQFVPVVKDAEETFKMTVAALKGIQAGLEQFCESIGILPDRLLTLFPPAVETIIQAQSYLNDVIPADQEMQEDTFNTLCKMWPNAVHAQKGVV